MAADPVAEVTEHEDRRWAAMIAKDIDALSALFADELSYTHSNASVDTKSSYLKAIEERYFDYRTVEAERHAGHRDRRHRARHRPSEDRRRRPRQRAAARRALHPHVGAPRRRVAVPLVAVDTDPGLIT